MFKRLRTQVTYNGLLLFPEQVIEHGWTDTFGDERCTDTDYVFNISASVYMLGFPQRVTRYDNATSCSGSAVTRTEIAYDGGAVGAAPTLGNPTNSRVQVSPAPSPVGTWSTTTTGYDPLGRVISVTDPNGHTATTAYNDTGGAGYPFNIKVTNHLGHVTETQLLLVRQVPAWSEDANDKRTTYAYDALGRASKVWQPTEPTNGPASWEFAYDVDPERDEVPVIQTRQLQDLDGAGGTPRYLDTWVLYDALLRQRQTHTRSPDTAKTIVSDTTYDGRGLVNLVNVPEAVPGTPGDALLPKPADGWRNYHQTAYDHVGRAYWELDWADDADTDLVANNLQWLDAMTFTHETVEVDPAVGNAGNTRTKTDGLGRTVEVSEHDGSAYRTTGYTYDKVDQLLTVTDPADNTITYTYDMAGRRTTMDDPDAGDWSYGYDPAGNQTSVTDALNAVVHTSYDDLNRPFERRKDNPTSGQLLASWAYDAPGELGLLDSSTRVTPTGNWVVDVTGYDTRNRAIGRSWDLPDGITGLSGPAGTPEYPVTYGYDQADHATTVGYPAVGGLAAENFTTTYDAFGLPDTMTGLSEYVTVSAYDDRARPSLFGFGSAPSWAMGKTWEYDHNQRLGLQQATATGGSLVQDRTIAYDPVGNITERNTTLSGASFRECFGYDPRNRLTSAYTTAPANTCASGNGKGTGANPYDHTYAYAHDGNLETRNEGGTPANYSYPTSGTTSTRPHAPTQVGDDTYTWNANGNQASRTVDGQSDTLTWDAEHRLTSVNGQSGDNTFTYDADGTRLLRQTPQGTTIYIEGHEITVPAGQTTATAVRSYGFGGQSTATRTTSGVDYLVTDNQGTVEQTIPSGSATAEITRTYYPYGKLRTGNQPDTDHTWIGQIEDDTTGLNYLNARYYDPTIGVFTAPDPLYDQARPKSLNPFAYGLNNPVAYSDPTGLDSPCLHRAGRCSDSVAAAQFRSSWPNQHPPGQSPTHLQAVDVFTPPEDDLWFDSKNIDQDIADQFLNGNYRPCSGYELWYMNACKQVSEYLQINPTAGMGEAANLYNQLIAYYLERDAEAAASMMMGMVDISVGRLGAGVCSFASDTDVLMANGTTKPISEIEVGDRVLATNIETGRTEARTVTDTMVMQHDGDLLDLTIEDDDGLGVVKTTDRHRFWSETDRAWEPAIDLVAGEQLRQEDGRIATVVMAEERDGAEDMWNLTVEVDHNFYVDFGRGAVLVHNDDRPSAATSNEARRDAMREVGIPTSQQPIEVIDSPAGRQYVYEMPKEGGGTERWIVTEQLMDENHGPHWDAGRAKPGEVRDPSGRYRPYSGGKVSVDIDVC